MKYSITLLILLACTLALSAQSKKNLSMKYMLSGYLFAGTVREDTNASGGFADSDNVPKNLSKGFKTSKTGLFIYVDTLSHATFAQKYNGYKLFIVNKTDVEVGIPASDGCLNAVAEAWVDGKWQAVEYYPSSWCGNSYHTVFAKPNQFWEFVVPQYTGELPTKIRYRLQLKGNKCIYSNEFRAGINRKQLGEKQEHESQGLMDPYTD